MSGPGPTTAGAVRREERFAGWLQRLREATAALSRVFDRDAIERELARGAARIVEGRGAVVARQRGDEAVLDVAVHWTGGGLAVDPVPDAVTSTLFEVLRSGRPARADTAGLSVIGVPIRSGHRANGALAVYGHGDGYSEDAIDLVATLAATAAAVLETASVVNESIRDKRQSEALAELARALGTSHRLGEVLHLGLRHSSSILGAEGADIMLVRDGYLHIVAASGRSAPSQGLYVPVADSAAGRAMLEGRSLVVNRITPETGANPTVRAIAGVIKFISVPLRTPDGPIGVLSVVNRDADFVESDVRVLERLASQLAVAVVKVRLFEEAEVATRELRAAFDATAGGMAVVDGDGFIVRHNARLAGIAARADGVPLVGQSFYEVILGEAVPPSEAEPVGIAIISRSVGRGLMHPVRGDRVFEVVASPHPGGGAVVTVDDITSFLSLSERYRLVVDSTTDSILITDGDGTITFANDAATELFGRAVANAALRLSGLAPEECRGMIDDATLRALAGEALRFDTEMERTGGERRVVSVSVAPVRSGGRVTGLVASLRDATSEARARAAIAAADARYRNLVETANDAIFTADRSGAITSANAACALATGLPKEAMVGRSVTSLTEPDEAIQLASRFEQAMNGAGSHFECHVARADGNVRMMSVSFTPITAGGSPVGVLGIARDVTVERAQAAALERAEARYARLVESAQDGICTIDEEGRITSANRAFRRIVRRTRRDLAGAHFADLVPEHERGALWAMFAATLTGSHQRGEIAYRSHRGHDAIASVSIAPLIEHDRVAGVLAIMRDMTEERALLQRVARRDKLAALGELVGGVAHEVNSPLTGIMAHAQLLQADFPLDADARHSIDTIVNESRRAARIVGKLLAFARQNPSERVPSDINQIVLDTIELRRYPLRMQGVELEIALAEGLPTVSADPFQLQQVFINLLSNAEQAVVTREAGARRITVKSAMGESDLLVTVTDNGSGIAPEHLPHIFNPFYTTKPRGVGTGLGLSISFGIMREHGGSIQAHSQPGQGATFTVILPFRDARGPGRLV